LLHVLIEPAAVATLPVPVTPRRRGEIFIDAIWLGWEGPFFLVRFTKRVKTSVRIGVVPNVRAVQKTALEFLAREADLGLKVQRQSGEGAEFEALRDYMPGLDPRHIDWKRSARHHRLLSKEFQTERNHQIILAFDTGYLMGEPVDGLARLDHAINAALVLAWISLSSGDFVGVFAFDGMIRNYRAPERGLNRFRRIQNATAELAYHGEETNFTLGLAELSLRLNRRALVILFTDFVDTVTAELMIESLERTARRHVVVLVTLQDETLRQVMNGRPRDFGAMAQAIIAGDLQQDRQIVFERLERLGLHCLHIRGASLPTALVNRYLLIKQRGLL
jgi:uncharacterized protein (DUF58 family)